MSKSLSRAVTARSVVSCLVGLFLVAGCSNGSQVTLARPQHKSHTAQGLSSGYSGTAQFDAPVVNPNTWQGSPIGTGTWSTAAAPPLAGGPSSIGFLETSNGLTVHYLMVGNFAVGAGNFFGIVSEGQQLTVGTSTINNTSLHAGIFDAATGDPVAMASSGTITLTAAGGIGGRLTGSFSGTLDDVVVGGCTSSAQCAAGEQCLNGSCIRTGCISSSQCATGQFCSNGQCVTTPVCTSNAQCGGGQICSNGQCVTPPGCTSNAQCGGGQVCQSGQCVTVAPAGCNGKQGKGDYAGSAGSTAVCSAFGSGAVAITSAFAAIGDDGSGQLSLYVMDPQRDSAGLIFPLNACPGTTGSVAISGAAYWDQTTSGGVTFYAAHPATSATIHFAQVGALVQGSFWVSLGGGGQLKGSFDVQ